MNYIDKLKDPRWQKKRLKVLERYEFRCQFCWDDKTTLHVHHKYYKRGLDPWKYPMKALITVCENCHEKLHLKKEDYQKNEMPSDYTEHDYDTQTVEQTPEQMEQSKKAKDDFFKRFRDL